MRIAVNAVSARSGGGVRHLTSFLDGLSVALPASLIEAFVPSNFDARRLSSKITITHVSLPAGMSPRRLFWDQFQFPRLTRDFDVVVSPMNVGTVRIAKPHLMFQQNALYFDRSYRAKCGWRLRCRLWAYRTLAGACIRFADRVVVPSKSMANLLIENGVGEEKIDVLPHGFDSDRVRRLSAAPLPAVAQDWAKREVRLLHVGFPSLHKNLDVLLDVLRLVRIQHPDASLALTISRRDAPLAMQPFLQRIDDLDLRDHVEFLGPIAQDEIYSVFKTASVFLFPSLCESFGFPLVEAIALGTPVVASDIPSNLETVGQFGHFHSPADYEEAARLVLEILSDPATQPKVDPAEFLTRFSWHHHCEGVANILREIERTS